MNMPAPGFYAPAADRYAHMPYVRCGRSGLKLPRVSLGLWNNFGSVTPQDTARDMLLTAFDAASPTSIWQTTTALAPARQKKRWGKLWTATCVRTATS